MKKELQEERCDPRCPPGGDCESFQGHRLPLGWLTECQLLPPKPQGPGGGHGDISLTDLHVQTCGGLRSQLLAPPVGPLGGNGSRPLVISPHHAHSKDALRSDASLL